MVENIKPIVGLSMMENMKPIKISIPTVIRTPKLPKLSTQTQAITYKKLVVPVSMRSIYWKFFGFPATDEGEIITKAKIICVLCKTQIAYNKNTSNLRMHLQNKHTADLNRIEKNIPPIIKKEKKLKKPPRQMYSLEGESEDMQVEIQNDLADRLTYVVSEDMACLFNEGSEKLTESICRHIIKDLASPDIVQSSGFLKLVVSLVSPCRIPSLQQITYEYIPQMYSKIKNQIIEEISKLTDQVSLTVEEWSADGYMPNVSVSLYFYDEDGVLQHRLLVTQPLVQSLPTGSWEEFFTRTLSEYNIAPEKVSAVVYSTNTEQIITALKNKGFTIIPCIDFTIQNCVQSCFDNDEIKDIVTRVRETIALISTHKELMNTFRDQEIGNELEPGALKMDHENVWLTTFTMLDAACARRYILQNLLVQYFEDDERSLVYLTDSQWEVLQDVRSVLEPFKMIIQTLCEDRISLASILKPVLWQLTSSKLQIEEEDSVTASSLKHGLSDLLTYKYYNDETSYFLDMCSMLDPRFKVLPYIQDKTKQSIGDSIKSKLVEVVQQPDCDVDVKKEIRMSGISLLLGSIRQKSNSTPEERADNEYTQYLNDVSPSLDTCPMQWWIKFSSKYPTLSQLANKYLCIPSFATLPGKISEEQRLGYYLKRSAVAPELVDKMLFLHVNQPDV